MKKIIFLSIILVILLFFMATTASKGTEVSANVAFSPSEPLPTPTLLVPPDVKRDLNLKKADYQITKEEMENGIIIQFGQPNCQNYNNTPTQNKWVKAVSAFRVTPLENGEAKMYQESLGENPEIEQVGNSFTGRPELSEMYYEALKLAIEKCNN